ncbi:hypothetical protein CHS0354_034743 [Potamilus streckersoni]|uniref:Acyl-coenzyme A thioesterase 8 n=1 Tax=Potamilus streckersoni TaxID=2493646 RepID=A0AAE0VIB4_9BIVA|nr:hypothetical protein CHS0354_034743 [Potamilus streckersoni]
MATPMNYFRKTFSCVLKSKIVKQLVFRPNISMSTTASGQTDLESQLIKSFLALERIDVNIFRANEKNLWQHPLGRFVFGGQVVGQALVAACETVTDDHHIHSLHCYFLQGGNSQKPILYMVDRTRDGKTFSNRSVKATQMGISIFTMQASFKLDETQVYKYQMQMPKVTGPEDLMDTTEVMQMQLKHADTPDKEREFIMKMLSCDIPIDIRPVDPEAYFRLRSSEPIRYVWLKAEGHIGDDSKVHQCMAAYQSDYSLLGVALQPGGKNYETTFMTSLDHTIWFHAPFRVDEWMLYEIFSPQCGSGRALCYGRVWKRDGTLAMSIAQEGVVRNKPVETVSKL